MVLRYIIICLIFLLGGNIWLKAQTEISVNDLPLQLSVSKGNKSALVIYLSGDGGWNEFNQKLVQEFEKLGYGVVSLNTRKYFGAKNPRKYLPTISTNCPFII